MRMEEYIRRNELREELLETLKTFIDTVVFIADRYECDRDEMLKKTTKMLNETVNIATFKDYKLNK